MQYTKSFRGKALNFWSLQQILRIFIGVSFQKSNSVYLVILLININKEISLVKAL